MSKIPKYLLKRPKCKGAILSKGMILSWFKVCGPLISPINYSLLLWLSISYGWIIYKQLFQPMEVVNCKILTKYCTWQTLFTNSSAGFLRARCDPGSNGNSDDKSLILPWLPANFLWIFWVILKERKNISFLTFTFPC